MAFDQVIGQKRIKEILVSSLRRQRIAHAYLFHGMKGVGKDAAAIALAKSLLCREKTQGGCGVCPDCTKMMNLESPTFHFILPVPRRPKNMKEAVYNDMLLQRAKQHLQDPYRESEVMDEMTKLPVIGIDQVRAMKREVILKTSGGSRRIFLVSQADRMTLQAANSILKLLEEPPEGTVLILTTSSPGDLLLTIQSRCHALRFDPVPEDEIAAALVQRWQIAPNQAKSLARLSGGSVQRALAWLDDAYETRRDAALDFLERTLNPDPIKRIEGAALVQSGVEKPLVMQILQMLYVCLGDMFYLRSGFRDKVSNADRVDRLEAIIRLYPAFNAQEGMQSTQRSIAFMEKNVYLPLVIHSLSQDLWRCREGASS